MKKRIEWIGDKTIERHQAEAEACRLIIQGIVDDAPGELSHFTLYDIDEMLVSSHIEGVVRRLLAENVKVPAGINEAQYLQLIDIPASVAALMQAIQNKHAPNFSRAKRRQSNSDSNQNFPFSRPSEFLSMKDGKVSIQKVALDAIVSLNAKYAETKEEQAAIALAEQIAASLNELRLLMGNRSPSSSSIKIQFSGLTPAVKYSSINGTYSAQPIAILNSIRQ